MFGKNQVENISQKSSRILDVFTKTVDDLTILNTEIDFQSENLEKEKARIEADLATLNQHKEKHNSVISKINKIFE